MSQPEPMREVQELIETYTTSSTRRSWAYASLAGGAGAILAAIAGFFVALRVDAGMMQLQMMTTVPILMAIMLLTSGFRTLRGPSEVRLSSHGLVVVDRRLRARSWRWEQITFADTGSAAVGTQQQLTLHGSNGKPLVKLTNDFDRFDEMVVAVKRRIAEHPVPAPTRMDAQTRKARKTGAFLMAGGVFAWLLAGANIWIALAERESQQLLKERGVPAVATVVDKVIAPDGRTHRIHYRVDEGGKSDTANVEVAPIVWQGLKVGMQVEVVAVPGRPDVSRMVAGQIDDGFGPGPGVMLLLSGAIILMGIVFFGVGAMSWRGVEVSFDSKEGLRIKRIGQ